MSESLEEQLLSLQSLLQHPGYKYLKERLKADREALQMLSFKATDAHSMATAVGGLKVVTALEDWAERQVRLLVAKLKAPPDQE